MTNASPTTTSAQVREVEIADYPQIASLEARYGLHAKPQGEWLHLWTENPAYLDRQGWPLGWVLENESGYIVGYVGNIPSYFKLAGQRLLAASGRGLVVDERYRSYAFSLFSRFINQPDADLIVNTTVNAQAEKLHELFRCARVPVGDWDHSFFWITNYQGFAAKALTAKKLPLSGVLSYPAAAAFALKDVLRPSSPTPTLNGRTVEVCNAFDQRFDEFWYQLEAKRPNVLLTIRSSQVLNWHFKYSLAQGRAWIATVSAGSSLQAYAIFVRQDNYLTGLRRVRLVDFQALDEDLSLLAPVFSTALQRCRQQGIHMLEVIGFSAQKQAILTRFAPRQRQLPCWLYFYKAKDKELSETLKDPRVWDPAPFDGDGAL